MASSDVANALTDFGGAVSDLFGARGSAASAQSYRDAAAIAGTNAQIVQTATQVQETQEQRQIYKTIGAQEAAVSSAGFSESGTALDLLRESASQGALTKALTAAQGAIETNSYAEQAGFYNGMADAAEAAGQGQQLGGLLNLAGGALNLANLAGKVFSGGTAADVAGNAASAGSGTGVVAYGGAGDVAADSAGTTASTTAASSSLGTVVPIAATIQQISMGDNNVANQLFGLTGQEYVAPNATANYWLSVVKTNPGMAYRVPPEYRQYLVDNGYTGGFGA